MQANMHEAKSKLSQLADLAQKGERVIIAKAGKPYVELIPCREEARRPFGWLKGQVSVAADFDNADTNTSIADDFEATL